MAWLHFWFTLCFWVWRQTHTHRSEHFLFLPPILLGLLLCLLYPSEMGSQIKSYFPIVVTFLLLWQDTMTKATYGRKGLKEVYCPRGWVQWPSWRTPWQADFGSSELTHKHKAEKELQGKGAGFWNLKASPPVIHRSPKGSKGHTS